MYKIISPDRFNIYRITNLINNKVYIGQTNNPSLRWSQHRSNAKYARGTQIITRALTKYGCESFSFEIIAMSWSQECLDKLEEMLIIQYDSRNPSNGYNIDVGGNTSPRTPETLAKISAGLQEFYKTHESWNKGGKLTEEWKNNISIASMGKEGTNTGKKFSNEWVVGISKSLAGKEQKSKRRFTEDIEKDICGVYVDSCKSTYEIANDYGCQRSTISTILKRHKIPIRQSSYTGHSNNCNIFTLEQEKEICELYKQGNVSRAELSRRFKCGKTTIRDVLLRNGAKL